MFRHVLQAQGNPIALSPPPPSPPPPPPPFTNSIVTIPSLAGGQAILYGIVVTGVILVALCLTIRALYIRFSGNANIAQNNVDFNMWRANNLAPPTPGLDPSIIEALPLFAYSAKTLESEDESDATCVVCLEDYKDGDQLKRLPECQHAFHTACIDSWFLQHTTCPVCRVSLLPKQADEDDASDETQRNTVLSNVNANGSTGNGNPSQNVEFHAVDLDDQQMSQPTRNR